jgi:hypothetical protein
LPAAHIPAAQFVSDYRIGPPLTVQHNGQQLPLGKNPSVKQWAFIDRAEQEQLYGGSKSGGKTRALCAKLICLAVEFPGNQLGLFRKDMTDLKGSTLITFDAMLPKQLLIQHHKTDHYYLIRSKDPRYPTRMWYGGLGEQADFESAKGKEYGAFGIDEPSEIQMDVYLQMLAQLRWTLPDGYGTHDSETNSWRPSYQALLGSNPEPGWLEDHFGHLISRATEEVPIVTDGQRVYIMALPKDNPYLPPNWEQILRNQQDIPQSWIDKYLGGSWKASEGLVFKEVDERVHYIQCPPAAVLRSLSIVASLDHATTGVTCFCIDGIAPDGTIYALASYYQKNKLVSVHSQGIKELSDYWVKACGKEDIAKLKASSDPTIHWSMCGFDYVLIDPSTEAKTQQGATDLWSIQDLYRREGIPTVPAYNALAAGIKLMEEYIHVKPARVHPFKQQLGAPMWMVVRDNNLPGIKELESWKRTITVNKTIRYVGADHWIDHQRYIIMSRPVPPEFVTVGGSVAINGHNELAKRSMAKFDQTFGKDPSQDNQWFGGGTTKGNEWLGRPN